MRMNEAEKKAAALPPKLTVPMILFFLPVLFAIILGPAAIQVSARGGLFGSDQKVDQDVGRRFRTAAPPRQGAHPQLQLLCFTRTGVLDGLRDQVFER